MNNILIKLMFLGVFLSASIASTTSTKADVPSEKLEPETIQFIYLHGTGNNSQESEQSFIKKVDDLHAYMKPAFEKSSLIKEHFLKNNTYTIADKAIPFYWGDKTRELVESLNENLESTKKKFSLHEAIRSKIIHVLHDAIWLSDEHSKHIIIDSLHSKITNSVNDKEGFVIFGHSAGSIITYDYLKYALPIFDVTESLKRNGIDVNEVDGGVHTKNTCLKAYINSELARFDEYGELKPNKKLSDKNFLNERLKVLDVITPTTCIPDGKLKGIVTFGSPIAIFFSQSMVEGAEQRVGQKLVEYIYNNEIFWLHINHIDDAIGVALSRKKFDQYITAKKTQGDTLNKGFIENNNNKHWGATFINAHSWYWNKPKSFSKLVVETYETGYKHWFGTESLTEK